MGRWHYRSIIILLIGAFYSDALLTADATRMVVSRESTVEEKEDWYRQKWADYVEEKTDGAASGDWMKKNPCCCFFYEGWSYYGLTPPKKVGSHEWKCTTSSTQHPDYFWFWSGHFDALSSNRSWGKCCKFKWTSASEECGAEPWFGTEVGREYDDEDANSVQVHAATCLSDGALKTMKKNIDPGNLNKKLQIALSRKAFVKVFRELFLLPKDLFFPPKPEVVANLA